MRHCGITFCCMALVLSLVPNSHGFLLDWGDPGIDWGTGGVGSRTYTNVQSSGFDIRVTVGTSGYTANVLTVDDNPAPFDENPNTALWVTQNNFADGDDATTNESYSDVLIEFFATNTTSRATATDVSLTLYDIDVQNTILSGYRDRIYNIEASDELAGPATFDVFATSIDTFAPLGGTTTGRSFEVIGTGSSLEAVGRDVDFFDSNRVEDLSLRGQAQINFGSTPISQAYFRYASETLDSRSDPYQSTIQWIGLGPIFFTPEPATHATGFILLLLVATKQLQRSRQRSSHS